MASFSGSFTGVGDVSSNLRVKSRGETVSIAISGTYVQKIRLERARPSLLAWHTVKEWDASSDTIAFNLITQSEDEVYRLRVVVDTSGTAVYEISDGDLTLRTEVDTELNPIRTTTQAVDTFHKPVVTEQTFNGARQSQVQSVDPGQKFTLFEDFFGTWAIGDAGPTDTWSSTAGSGVSAEVATTVANSVNGEVTLKSSSLDAAISANASTFTGVNTAFKANKGGLVMEARLKISDISEAVLFVGFTDTISTTVELPLFLVAADIDSDATDAVGVGYDVDGTTKQFFHGGVKNGVDTAPVYSGGAPVDDTYFTVRIEVDTDGGVIGYIDGVAIGSVVANAVTATAALTPAIVIANRSANQVIATIDYVWVQQNR